MAGKVAESAKRVAHESALVCETEPSMSVAEVRPVRVVLSGTVRVDYDVIVTEIEGAAKHVVVRVEFPDEVRSMLEASTWTRGTTIHEAVSRLGAAFLERNGLSGLLGIGACDAGASRRPQTFHLPLSYVRSSLAAACASTT